MQRFVVLTCDFLVGMVVLRVISLVNTPPRVSMPMLSGVTSSRSTSVTSPASTPPWMAAPIATASSGFTALEGVRPNTSCTVDCTCETEERKMCADRDGGCHQMTPPLPPIAAQRLVELELVCRCSHRRTQVLNVTANSMPEKTFPTETNQRHQVLLLLNTLLAHTRRIT